MGILPPIDYSRFDWKPSKPEDPSYYSREAQGGEPLHDFDNRYQSGEQTLFLAAQVAFTNPISPSNLISHVRPVWETLRFETPTLAATIEQDEKDDTFISYRVAKDYDVVKAWSQRTLRLRDNAKNLDELRCQLSQHRLPEETGDQTFIYVLAQSDKSYGFLFHSHHTPFDGSAVQIILNDLITRVCSLIAGSTSTPPEYLAWGTEQKNLTPATCAILSPSEAKDGPLFDETAMLYINGLAKFARAIGFKPRKLGAGPTQRFQVTFSEEETARLVVAVRALGGTITQFAQAALTLVCYQDNPATEATPEDAVYMCFGISDMRNRLLPEYTKYTGYALGVVVGGVPASLMSSVVPKGEKEAIIETARFIKVEADIRRTTPAMMAFMTYAPSIYLPAMREHKANPPPNRSLCFVGDGHGEKFLSRSFDGPDGKPVAVLEDYFTSVNMTNPTPYFRVYSWRGTLRLSADANTNAMPAEDVQGFLDKWAKLLRLFL